MNLTMKQALEIADLIGRIEQCDALMRTSAPGLGATLVSAYADLALPLPQEAMALLAPVVAATRNSAIGRLRALGVEIEEDDTT